MKKAICVFSVLSLLLMCLSCCSKQDADGNALKGGATVQQGAVNEKPAGASVSAQDYYRYLNEQIIGKDQTSLGKLATEERLELRFNYSNEYDSIEIDQKGGTGILSAIVEDFDNDGSLEMTVIMAMHCNMVDTAWQWSINDPTQTHNMDLNDSVLLIRAYLLEYKEDGIQVADLEDISLMLNKHFGTIAVGIEKIEDAHYIFTQCYSENMSTYGISPYTVAKIEDNAVYKVYCSPMDYGYMTPGNTNELLGIGNPIDVQYCSLSDINTSLNGIGTVEAARESFGQRLLCHIDISVNEDCDALFYKVTDETNLRSYLVDNGKNWNRIPLPEGAFYEKPEMNEFVLAFTDTIAQQTGVSFEETLIGEEEGVYSHNVSTKDGTSMTVFYDLNERKIVSVHVNHYDDSPTEDWFAMKDAVLSSSVWGLSEEQVAPFVGTPSNWVDHMSGTMVGNCKITVGAVAATFFSITFTE